MPPIFTLITRCGVALWLASSALAGHAQAATAQPPLDSFFDNPRNDRAAFSPNGRLLAVITSAPGQRDALNVIDLATNKVHSSAFFRNADIRQFQWVNDKRLLFSARGGQEVGAVLVAADYDGSNLKQVASRYAHSREVDRQQMLSANTYLRADPGPKNSDSVYVSNRAYRTAGLDLLLLNTVSGEWTEVKPPADTQGWMLDHLGQPRLAFTVADDAAGVAYRNPASGKWEKMALGDGAYKPVGFGPDGTLYVQAANGKDKQALYAFDMASGKLREPALVDSPDYDISGTLIMSKDGLLGMRLTTDAERIVWFEPAMQALQKEIDQQLVNTVNLLTVPTRAETPWVLVEVYSDVRPKTLLLYNTHTKAFSKIGESHPGIRPEQMGRQQTVRYKARDGLEIPALLTMPANGKQDGLPLVVLVHGGPWVRGSTWGWRAESQFLASRGYAVLEPAFRGSTGLGWRHYRAGWKQWGLAMQDDLADGARWAIGQGIADSKRICIAGSSYGGYAALMGVVNDPALYRCAVEWAGVTDINLLYSGTWNSDSPISNDARVHSAQLMIGDPVKDLAQLQVTSPLRQAARITRPLLMAHGGGDLRVPLNHGEKFYDAVRKTNPDVEWVMYRAEGHGWHLPETRIDFWRRVEKFLDRHIGTPGPTIQAAPAPGAQPP
jgi:dipeptidyl aminopeptidase/acylaminoacyl peptidase